jgi:hypothetical protein
VAKHKEEGIYAFALYSDDGAMTVCPAVNTWKHLEEAGGDSLSKFCATEWAYEGEGADEKFEAICTLLRNEVFAHEDDEESFDAWFDGFQGALHEACVGVLIDLKRKRFFEEVLGSEIFLNFEVTEHEFSRQRTREIIAGLNGEKYRNEYFEWMKSWKK